MSSPLVTLPTVIDRPMDCPAYGTKRKSSPTEFDPAVVAGNASVRVCGADVVSVNTSYCVGTFVYVTDTSYPPVPNAAVFCIANFASGRFNVADTPLPPFHCTPGRAKAKASRPLPGV